MGREVPTFGREGPRERSFNRLQFSGTHFQIGVKADEAWKSANAWKVHCLTMAFDNTRVQQLKSTR